MIDIPCIIFAGGKSSRMGEDKALLPFGEFSTLTEFQLHKLQKIFTHVYISCKDKNKFHFKAQFIEDIQSHNVYAPTTGFLAVFEKFQSSKFFVLSVDTPFVNKNEIMKLLSSDTDNVDATIATLNNQIQPMCGIYHPSLYPSFQDMLDTNKHKLGYLLKNSNTQYVNFENNTSFLNLNKPQDYQDALTLI